MRRIKIFDTTLRDGEQSPGIALSPSEKAEIARHAGTAGRRRDRGRIRRVVTRRLRGRRGRGGRRQRATVASLARTTAEDIDAAAAALEGAHRRRIHVFIATSALHMERKLGLTPDEVLERVGWSVAYAVDKGDEVEFSAEDATRSDRAFLAEVCRARGRGRRDDRQSAGHGRLHLAGRVRRAVRRDGRAAARSSPRVELSVHCHDDLGLAVANSLAGVGAGATQVECTVNGIGERAGNASLEEIVMAMRVRADAFDAETGIDPRVIREASALVRDLTGYVVAPQQADRRRERVRARGRHPPGRDAQGRRDVPDHRPERARHGDDAAARQALRPPRVRARLRGSRPHARARTARRRVPPLQAARRPRRARLPRRGVPGGPA